MGKAEGSVAPEEWHGHVTALSVAPVQTAGSGCQTHGHAGDLKLQERERGVLWIRRSPLVPPVAASASSPSIWGWTDWQHSPGRCSRNILPILRETGEQNERTSS
ncbi:hypothetical protein AMELA_G00280190 [Ameiurus melas]|uniref:Uncharacterized protein n=1 Tax=Ameiurus melas TaxID=219545 RepID=A0A7J5ZKL5_AMEME|nr:hypothetical protein AMELA_G00280190 [Ameiurus melas]